MTGRTLIRRSLRFHWRSHLGVVLGAAIGSAALIGALIVGDSVRETLRERAIRRLGNADNALVSNDRFFREELGLAFVGSTAGEASATLLQLPGTAANTDGTARAGNVQVWGVRNYFNFARPYSVKTNSATAEQWRFQTDLPNDSVLLNAALATQLGVRAGDTVLLRLQKPSALSRDAVITPQSEHSVTMRLRVNGIVDADHGGDLNLRVSQMPTLNAFVRLEELSRAAGIAGRANVILAGAVRKREPMSSLQALWQKTWERFTGQRLRGTERIVPEETAQQLARLNATFQRQWEIEDTETTVRAANDAQAEVSSPRIFLDEPVVQAAITPGVQKARPTNVVLPVATAIVQSNYVMVTRRDIRRAQDAGLLPVQLELPPEAEGKEQWLMPANSPLARNVPGRAAAVYTGRRPSIFRSPRPATSLPTAIPILTYLVNQFRAGTNTTPYSMVTGAGAPYTPADLRDDEIVVNSWLAEDLGVKPGDSIALAYFVADQVSSLTERTNVLRVRSIVPLEGRYADKSLMPEFPGLSKAESTHDWDAGFPLVHKIREKDEAYWKQHRGTPKAFVTLAAAQQMWSNRFGRLTAVRWEPPAGMTALQFAGVVQENLMHNLDPAELGFAFQPVREQALQAVQQSQDFGGLFIGFSFFLIGAALILMGLLFTFGLQQRAEEIGTLLALGFTPRHVRKLFLCEGAALALFGSIIGVAGGIFYARAMLHGLTTIWRDATNTSALTFHLSPGTLAMGLVSGTLIAVVTIWIVLRKQARQPARELLAGETSSVRSERDPASSVFRSILKRLARASIFAWGTLALAIAILVAAFVTKATNNPGFFFGAGSLALLSGLAFTSLLLERMLRGDSREISASALSVRGAARRKTRSVATVALIACGVFLIVAIGAFRLDADQDAWKRDSGTGGFALIGESTLPIVKDLNTVEGRDALGLNEKTLQGVSFVPLRVRDGDDASCLNLNRAQQPRVLGVGRGLVERGAFAFAAVDKDAVPSAKVRDGWLALFCPLRDQAGEVPAVGDAASIQWALGKKLGDRIPYRDEHGKEFKLWIAGTVANSILQGSLIVDEGLFTQRFPGVSGYRMFLIDAPSNAVAQVSAELTRALQDYGFEVTPAARRLAQFNAVQNTYLSTFQVLGGLGLLLGSLGLGIVVLRNVLERRGELALLIAVGFRRGRVQKLVLAEHAALLGLGLLIGIVAALVAILPSLLSPRAGLPVQSLALTLGGVLLFGLISTWLATRVAVRGNLLEGLRNE